jgi:AcrR family transcriptional regulator
MEGASVYQEGKSVAGKKRAAAVPKKPRADAERNRNRLIEVAKAAFTDIGPEVSLEEIARIAGVGIGTLYRHFPTRDAVLEAVYRREVQQLAAAAGRLLETQAPVAALRAWMGLFIDYIATKKIIAPALNSLTGGTAALFASSGVLIKSAVTLLVERAVAAGDIRRDVDPIDLLYALVGFANANNGPGWEPSARRLLDILITGLRREST